jgi:calcineurin-binding protein cabin-1
MDTANQPAPLSSGLYVDLQPDELLISSPDGPAQFKGLDMNWFETLNRIKNILIKQTTEDNLETAVTLMKSTYNFYRESSCGTFPSGINLYTVTPAHAPMEGLPQVPPVVETLDLSIPRKLLLWVYTLVHGRYSNISSVVKYCDEMKVLFAFLMMGSFLSFTFSQSSVAFPFCLLQSRTKRGTSAATASTQVVQPIPHSTVSSQVFSSGPALPPPFGFILIRSLLFSVAKEKSAQVESNEAAHDANSSAQAAACAPAHQEVSAASASQTAVDAQKATGVTSQLNRSGSSRAMENAPDSMEGK